MPLPLVFPKLQVHPAQQLLIRPAVCQAHGCLDFSILRFHFCLMRMQHAALHIRVLAG